jgi:hypothetical protein
MSWLQAISNRITHIKNQTTLKLMSLLSTRMSWLQAISNRITHIKKTDYIQTHVTAFNTYVLVQAKSPH